MSKHKMLQETHEAVVLANQLGKVTPGNLTDNGLLILKQAAKDFLHRSNEIDLSLGAMAAATKTFTGRGSQHFDPERSGSKTFTGREGNFVTPTIGQDMLYRMDEVFLASTVCNVLEDGRVTLTVHYYDGKTGSKQNVLVHQGALENCPDSQCCLMKVEAIPGSIEDRFAELKLDMLSRIEEIKMGMGVQDQNVERLGKNIEATKYAIEGTLKIVGKDIAEISERLGAVEKKHNFLVRDTEQKFAKINISTAGDSENVVSDFVKAIEIMFSNRG